MLDQMALVACPHMLSMQGSTELTQIATIALAMHFAHHILDATELLHISALVRVSLQDPLLESRAQLLLIGKGRDAKHLQVGGSISRAEGWLHQVSFGGGIRHGESQDERKRNPGMRHGTSDRDKNELPQPGTELPAGHARLPMMLFM